MPALLTACGLAAATAAMATAAHAGTTPSAASAATGVPSPATGVSRVYGADRYLTGVQVSQSQWADAGGDATTRAKAQAVVLTRGDTFPDALSGVPLAAKVHGPLLLTTPASLSPVTAAEIRRVLGPGAGQPVYILGGTGAVSAAVEAQLTHDGYAVTRYQGANRYLTALDVARRGLGSPSRTVVATGDGYADALTAGPFAAGPDAVNGAPAAIVLSDGRSMDPATAAYVSGKIAATPGDCTAVTAVGGQAAMAVAQVTPAGGCSTPLSGPDRYATAEAVAKRFPSGTSVGVATGGGFADALTGGAAMAALGRPLVLTAPALLGDHPRLWLVGAHQAGVTSTVVFGGPSAVSNAVFAQLQDIANGGDGLPVLPPPPPVNQLCGAPTNPYGFNYCGAGSEVTRAQVPADICSYFSCIGTDSAHTSFWKGVGYLEVCNDGDISLSGGRSGACSSHGGENHPVWKR